VAAASDARGLPVEQHKAGRDVHFGYMARRAERQFGHHYAGVPMAKAAMDIDMLRMRFFDSGFQYYVAARFAVTAGLVPVAGNLFHHAIEMCLKGELAKRLDEGQRRNIGHKLTKLWSTFKKQMAAEDSLASFDPVIEQLSKFEDIRYPEGLVLKGMLCTFAFGKAMPAVSDPQRSEPVYQLAVGEIDALFKAILEKSSINPKFYTNRFNEDASTYLRRQNETGL